MRMCLLITLTKSRSYLLLAIKTKGFITGEPEGLYSTPILFLIKSRNISVLLFLVFKRLLIK